MSVNELVNEFTGGTRRHDCAACKERKVFFVVQASNGMWLCLGCADGVPGPLYRWSVPRQKYEQVARDVLPLHNARPKKAYEEMVQ